MRKVMTVIRSILLEKTVLYPVPIILKPYLRVYPPVDVGIDVAGELVDR